MKLGIICPLDSIEFIAEHTDFDVALGYMAMRYNKYLAQFINQGIIKRDIALLQMPERPIRADHYLTTARRLQPTYWSTTPKVNPAEQLHEFMHTLGVKRRYEEFTDTLVLPYIGPTEDEATLSIYTETTKYRFVHWSRVEELPLKFSHASIIVGMVPPSVLRKIKPFGFITLYPILCAQRGLTLLDENGELYPIQLMLTTPDWILTPLTDNALALAVENIKELRSVISKT